jgi:transcriptional regulator with XRE-family HTH domain
MKKGAIMIYGSCDNATQESEVNKMDYAKLRGRIVEKFQTQSAFARAMGKNTSTINGKLNGKSQWTADEIEKACGLLDIPLTEAHLYFFCKKSCENATA